jgi:hypothetical protein
MLVPRLGFWAVFMAAIDGTGVIYSLRPQKSVRLRVPRQLKDFALEKSPSLLVYSSIL